MSNITGYCVLEIDAWGIPASCYDMGMDWESALNLCASIAKENGVSDEEITEEILNTSEPGVFYSNDQSDKTSVWVIAKENPSSSNEDAEDNNDEDDE